MVLDGQGAVLVHIDLGNLQSALVCIGQIVQYRGDHLARATPFGPEIHQDRFAGLQYSCIEVGIADMLNLVAHVGSPGNQNGPPERAGRYIALNWGIARLNQVSVLKPRCPPQQPQFATLSASMQAAPGLPRAPHEDGIMSDKPLTDLTFSTFDLHPALIAGLETPGLPAVPRSRR